MTKRPHQVRFQTQHPTAQVKHAGGFVPLYKQEIVDNSRYPGPMVKLLGMKRGISRKRKPQDG